MEARTSTQICSYVVALERSLTDAELRELAAYLSELGVLGCDVVILDASQAERFRSNANVLRWVGRHLPVSPEQRTRAGRIDRLRAVCEAAACEKIIVAGDDVRWSHEGLRETCDLLDRCEVVEPHEYLEPLPWWSGIDAGRALLLRAVAGGPTASATLGIRRRTARVARMLATREGSDGLPERLAASADVFVPAGLFVQRVPRGFAEWLRQRPVSAAADFAMPVRSGFFLSIVPLLIFFLLAGGAALTSTVMLFTATGTVMLALRGRAGAARFFPLHVCFLAPVALIERSVSCYWALLRRLSGGESDPLHALAGEDGREKAASGGGR